MRSDESDAAQRARDAAELAQMGYAQQLRRGMGGFSSFALSFSIISILTGAVTLYGHGLGYGGPLGVTLGWPIVALLTLAIAASLAELASAFPTAGALYHWASLLGGPAWGFFTAWLNIIGQFAITAGIDYGLAKFGCGLLGWPDHHARVLAVFVPILVSHAVLNHVGVRVVAALNDVSAWWHVAGTLALIAALIIFAPMQPAGFLLTRFTVGGHGYPHGFLVGLLLAAWTFTGYDASAHVGEETIDPRRNAPRAIMMAVAVSAVFGWAMLVVVTLAIGDLQATASSSSPFVDVLRGSLGSRAGGALSWMIVGAMWFCGLSSVTSNSRMLFAVARDGGLPGAVLLARVSSRWQTPHVAVWVSAAAALAVAAFSRALEVMTALSTIALYASYAAPIVVAMRARRSGRWTKPGPWTLGRAATAVNVVAIVWVCAAMVLFVLPPNVLAGETFVVAMTLLAVYWLVTARHHFRGPAWHPELAP